MLSSLTIPLKSKHKVRVTETEETHTNFTSLMFVVALLTTDIIKSNIIILQNK